MGWDVAFSFAHKASGSDSSLQEHKGTRLKYTGSEVLTAVSIWVVAVLSYDAVYEVLWVAMGISEELYDSIFASLPRTRNIPPKSTIANRIVRPTITTYFCKITGH